VDLFPTLPGLTKIQGNTWGTLLLKEELSDQSTSLLAILKQGESFTLNGTTITHSAAAVGQFQVAYALTPL